MLQPCPAAVSLPSHRPQSHGLPLVSPGHYCPLQPRTLCAVPSTTSSLSSRQDVGAAFTGVLRGSKVHISDGLFLVCVTGVSAPLVMVSFLTSELLLIPHFKLKPIPFSSPLYSSLLALEQGGSWLPLKNSLSRLFAVCRTKLVTSELTSGGSIDLQACLCPSLSTPLLPASCPFCPLDFPANKTNC